MLLRWVEDLEGPGGRNMPSSISSSSGMAPRWDGLSSSPSSDEEAAGLAWAVLCADLEVKLPDAFEEVKGSG
jgi:hypothetical protein